MKGGSLQLLGLHKSYGDVPAVRGIDLDIAAGEFFSLLGPSGCGKTTTLRMIAGFETPTSGEIRIDGADVSRIPANDRPVNTVFQNYALFPFMTVEDNVAFGLRYQKVGKADGKRKVAESLDMVRMGQYAKRRPGQLSGGQQQRVALARAIVLGPRVLLLDEPLGALDAKLRKTLQVELKSLQESLGITFVYVTHDQEEALTMSDRMAVMAGGQVEQVGTPAEVYAARAKATPTGRDGHWRIRHDKVDKTGRITIRHASKLHHIGIGYEHTGTTVRVLIHDLHITVINSDTGEIIRDLQLDTTRDYQPLGRPPGPPKGSPQRGGRKAQA